MSRQRYPWGELMPLYMTENHRLVVIPPERRKYIDGGPGEYTHPSARQYEVTRYGSCIGTLSKERFQGYGYAGGFEWRLLLNGADDFEERTWGSLAEAKRALRVTGVRQEATR
jgi:hypothetical protein